MVSFPDKYTFVVHFDGDASEWARCTKALTWVLMFDNPAAPMEEETRCRIAQMLDSMLLTDEQASVILKN
jgi:hypothetical protein